MNVEVVNSLGKVVYNKENTSEIATELEAGVYFVKITSGNSSQIYKQIVK